MAELQMGSRRNQISQARSELASQLIKDFGLPLAEVARQLGVSTSAISKILTRSREKQVKPVNHVSYVKHKSLWSLYYSCAES